MEKDYAKEIEARKILIDSSFSQMKKVRVAFATGIVPFAKRWIQMIARQYVERNPEIALKLGREKLAQLKARTARLCEDIEGICQEVFGSEEFWPETRELVTQNQLGIKIVLGKLGIILEEFGFVKTKAQTEGDQESWNQYDTSGNRREFDGTTIYPHSIEIPVEMKDLVEEYRKLIQRKDSLKEEIKQLEFEKLQLEATKLWDSI
jgi:hypothetical protein